MFSEIIALQFITSFLPNVLLYVEIMANWWDARLITQKALDFIFAREDSDDEGIIDGEKEEFVSSYKSEFENELQDANGEPEISGPLAAPRARGLVQTRGIGPAPCFMLYHTTIGYNQKQNSYS